MLLCRMSRSRSILVTALGVLITSLSATHASELNVLHSTEIDSSALNFSSAAATFSQNINGRTFQRSPMATFRGYQYATYYDGNRRVCLARRKLPAGAWEVIRFTDNSITSHDSHNVVALGICEADGTVHLACDHHNDPLNYRGSVRGVASNPESVPWSTSLFGAVTDRLGAVGRLSSVTYPTFFPAPNGNLMFYYRLGGSGNGDGMVREYNGATHQWTTGLGKFITRTGTYSGAITSNSTSRNPYLNGISYAGNRMHASWGWRESTNGNSNHDIAYAYSDDHGRTWRNSAGAQIGATGSSFISINSPGLVVAAIPQGIGLSNQYTNYAYPDGSCHVIVAHKKSGTSNQRYHHYWRNAAGTWSGEALPFSGSRPKLVGDDNRELFLAYTSGGILRVAKGTPNPGRTAWSWSTIHSQTGRTEGGDGHIDVTRWETDRILSVYGQVAPASNGAPTALNVFDYQVSATAILSAPGDEQTEVELSSSLDWTGGIDAVTQRVYLGTNPIAVAAATPASAEYRGEQAVTTYTPPAALASNLTYYWRIDTVDSDSTVHPGRVWSFTTAPDYLFSELADAGVRENLAVIDQAKATTLLGTGGTNPWVDRCTVYVFQLPDLGAVAAPFTSASFRFHVAAKQNSLKDNDLYGLGRRNSPTVLGSDYYGQTAASDPSDATRLQTDILTDATPLGVVSTSTGGNAALLNYLNAQYQSGAGIGKYVFLRLNTAAPKTGINRATLTMAEAAAAATRPRITYTANEFTNITMVRLGTPADLTNGNTWSDWQPAHAGSHYTVPATGHLRSETGTSTFPGLSLTVDAGGRFQVRAIDGQGEATTVDDFVLNGGGSFTSEQFAEVTAGTGAGETNALGGVITNSGHSRFLTYGKVGGNTIDRSLAVRSRIDGSGRIQVMENSADGLTDVTVTNAANNFDGTWEIAAGSTLIFTNAGAVGPADVEVQAGGSLKISENWMTSASLTVADAPGTNINLGSHGWEVDALTFGGAAVGDDVYSAAELNGLGSNTVFTGTGTITVGTGIPAPAISRVTPDSGTQSGDTLVAVTGSGFVAGTTSATVGGVPGTQVNVLSDSQLEFRTPAGTPGARDVTVTTPNGSATETGGFTYLIDPPTISQHPQTIAVLVGDALVLEVVASGHGPLSFQWNQDGVAVPGATEARFEVANSEVGQAGDYTVDVTNAAGTVTSEVATITVRFFQPDNIVSKTAAGPGAGDGIYNGSGSQQQLALISRRVRRVRGFARVQNDGNETDTLRLTGSRGNKIFRVAYLAREGNITAAILAGTHVTADVIAGDSVLVTVQVRPVRKKIKKRTARGTKWRKKRITLILDSRSQQVVSKIDRGIFRVQTR